MAGPQGKPSPFPTHTTIIIITPVVFLSNNHHRQLASSAHPGRPTLTPAA